ncbi:MAG: hypothetical protein P4L92_00810, partial [Rudaea sp.]|nr:hypothetical protein [Rudaea sp.]
MPSRVNPANIKIRIHSAPQDHAGVRRVEPDHPFLNRHGAVFDQAFPTRVPLIDLFVHAVDQCFLARKVAVQKRLCHAELAREFAGAAGESVCGEVVDGLQHDLALAYFGGKAARDALLVLMHLALRRCVDRRSFSRHGVFGTQDVRTHHTKITPVWLGEGARRQRLLSVPQAGRTRAQRPMAMSRALTADALSTNYLNCTFGFFRACEFVA